MALAAPKHEARDEEEQQDARDAETDDPQKAPRPGSVLPLILLGLRPNRPHRVATENDREPPRLCRPQSAALSGTTYSSLPPALNLALIFSMPFLA